MPIINRSKRLISFISIIACVVFAASAAHAEPTTQSYEVKLVDNQNNKLKVADLILSVHKQGYRYTIEMLQNKPFSDFFLSMRPFKCLTETQKKLNLCYLRYPYENKRFISKQDLTDLEYDLLFIRRTAKDYGINPWHGSYYRLQWQGDVIKGELYEVDLDILAAPPENGNLRPIVSEDLTETEADKFWFPRLVIEKK